MSCLKIKSLILKGRVSSAFCSLTKYIYHNKLEHPSIFIRKNKIHDNMPTSQVHVCLKVINVIQSQ